MVTPQSLLHSPLRILGTHAHMPGVSSKPPGPGREPRSTMWESSDIAITLTAGSPSSSFFFFLESFFCVFVFVLFCFVFCFAIGCVCTPDRQRETETESEKSPPGGDGHARIPSPFSSQDLGHSRSCARHKFKPPGLGRKPWSTAWESSDIAITLTAGSPNFSFFKATLDCD